MNRLLWKEVREKWIWLAMLIASTSGLILMHDSYLFLGDDPSPWLLISMLVAAGLGASTYATELAGGAADFVRSRPISWKKLLLAKFVVGLAFVLVSTLLATAVFRLTCPPQYTRFAGFACLAHGFGEAMLTMGCAYLAGFMCSMVLPGAFGGMLLMGAVVTSYMFAQYCLEQMHAQPWAYWSGYLGVIGAAVAVVLISRFGLTLPTAGRLKRCLSIIGIFVLVGLPLDYLVKWDPFNPAGFDSEWNLSADGDYAALERTRTGPHARSEYHSYLVRVSDGRRASAPWSKGMVNWFDNSSCWYNSTFAALDSVAEGKAGSPTYLWIGRMDRSGRLSYTRTRIARYKDYYIEIVPSPSGRRIMVAAVIDRKYTYRLTFADMDTMQPLGAVVSADLRYYWWQSDTEVCYTDAKDKRHMIRVAQ